jgi:hypothetical protein
MDDKPDYSGMTVNERLFTAGFSIHGMLLSGLGTVIE